MAEYKSAYTGEQIDSGIGKANTAVQPADLSAYQELLVSGTNIKTINNYSILGEGNLVIEGGGGTSNFNVRVVDATNPDDWSVENDGPSQAVLEDICENHYQAIRIINVPIDEAGSTYELDMFLTALIDSDENEYWAREYQKFDSGDEEEDDPAYMQTFGFEKSGSDDAEMSVHQYELGGGSSGGGDIFFQEAYLAGNDYDEISLDLVNLTAAIDNNREVVIKVREGSNYPTRYFRISSVPASGKTYISGPDVDCWLPTLECILPDERYYMVFDRYESEAYIFKIYEGYPRYTPTTIDIDNETIILDNDDYSYIFNNKPEKITLNLDEEGGEFWVDFNRVFLDETSGAESYFYTSNIVPVTGVGLLVFTFNIFMNSGNVETSIKAEQLTTSVPV